MNGSQVLCPTCGTPLPPELFNLGTLADCPNCAAPLQVQAFPALHKPIAVGSTGEVITLDGDAGCFYHPQKKASVPCDRCGRFLCALCDIDLNGGHLCPACVESGKQKGQLTSLENRRVLYDDIAMALAIYPAVLCYFSVPLTAPTAIYLTLRHWKAPVSLVPRTKARFVVALILATLQILSLAGWVVYLIVA